jgi:hypothetical protein
MAVDGIYRNGGTLSTLADLDNDFDGQANTLPAAQRNGSPMVTCNIQCSGGKGDHRIVAVRFDTLPHDLPGRLSALVCKGCGVARHTLFRARNRHNYLAQPRCNAKVSPHKEK